MFPQPIPGPGGDLSGGVLLLQNVLLQEFIPNGFHAPWSEERKWRMYTKARYYLQEFLQRCNPFMNVILQSVLLYFLC